MQTFKKGDVVKLQTDPTSAVKGQVVGTRGLTVDVSWDKPRKVFGKTGKLSLHIPSRHLRSLNQQETFDYWK